jgi:hypothetical protein
VRELIIPSNPLTPAESTGTGLTIYILLYQNPCLSQVLQHRTDFPSPYSELVVRPARQDRTGQDRMEVGRRGERKMQVDCEE